MSYLDKDGVPRLAEDIQQYNTRIDEVIHNLDDIQVQLTHVFNKMPDDRWKNDAEIAENLHHCNVLLEKCKERCEWYYMFG